MDADELLDFIEHRMRMSHIYQPLLIRSLLDAGGLATLRQLAVEFARSDEAQIRYYQDRITKMPVPVLARHGVLNRDGDLVSLTLDDMSFEEQARLRAACEQRIGRFLAERPGTTACSRPTPFLTASGTRCWHATVSASCAGQRVTTSGSKSTTSSPVREAGRTTQTTSKCSVPPATGPRATGTTPTSGSSRSGRAARPVSSRRTPR